MDAAFDDAVRAGITSIMAGPGSSNVVGGQFAFIKTKGRRIDDLIVKAPAAMKIAFGENPKVNFPARKNPRLPEWPSRESCGRSSIRPYNTVRKNAPDKGLPEGAGTGF